jgi:hypothetical protein
VRKKNKVALGFPFFDSHAQRVSGVGFGGLGVWGFGVLGLGVSEIWVSVMSVMGLKRRRYTCHRRHSRLHGVPVTPSR